MKVLIILCAIFGAAMTLPAGGGYGSSSSYHAHQTPVVVSVAQAPAPQYVQIPVASTNIYAPAAPAVEERPIVTGTMYLSQDTAGQYEFGYSSSDGQDKKESKPAGGDIEGQFSYTSPEGQDIKLQYSAGEDGFKAEGDHLPKEVELPEDLAEAYREANERLEKAHEEARLRGDVVEDDGQYKEGASEGEGSEGGSEGEKGQQEQQQGGGEQQQQQQHQQQVVYTQVQAVQAPIRYAPVKSVHYTAAIPSIQVAQVAPVVNTYRLPQVEVKKEAEAPSEPAPYSSSSYQTELGGPVAVQVVSAPSAPAPAAAESSHKKSGYSNGY